MKYQQMPNFGCFLTISLLCGCGGSPGGGEVKPPNVSPAGAASKAIELYDSDGSGQLSAEELKACPGILSAIGSYDTNGDGQVSSDEIAAQLETLFNSGVGLLSVSCTVTKGRRPMQGVTVRFVPEEFLGDEIAEASGVTDDNGMTSIMVPDENLPESYRGLGQMQPGVYRVVIEGVEPGGDDPPLGVTADPRSRSMNSIEFELK